MRQLQQEIIAANHRREEILLAPYACASKEGFRFAPEAEKVPDTENIRPTFFHDTDKIIHSMAYTRYIDKTQVFALFQNDHITHRVLHVQFVSKIARVIGRCLRLNEDLIEAIALGHDLGHTPYGHDGERFLNQLCVEAGIGYFCHNAQSVRFLMEIEQGGRGLNLTLQVLDGILAHNGEILNARLVPDTGKTPAQFLNEYESCFKVKDYPKKIYPMTLEGCVVRITDIIAYIGRDIEDAITVGLIKRSDLPPSITRVLGDTNDRIINTLALDVIEHSYGERYIGFSREIYKALQDLRAFNFEYIYHNPVAKRENRKIEGLFRSLFHRYVQDIKDHNHSSPIFRYYLKNMNERYRTQTAPARMAADFISAMTDEFFNRQYKELFFPKRFGLKIDEQREEDP
ncbi:MAG: HD domain-containing protein [Firmicutes bacterium]|nr:HD domain-containing protein [Bacillota bacterium]